MSARLTVEVARKKFGSFYHISKILGISRSSVRKWSEYVPDRFAEPLMRAPGGALRRGRLPRDQSAIVPKPCESIPSACPECGASFLGRKASRFCSRTCSSKAREKRTDVSEKRRATRRASTLLRTGGRKIFQNGYACLYLPDHPRASGGWVYEHVVVAEGVLGKALPPGACVHHINHNKTDNRPANLVICPSNSYHRQLHERQKRLGHVFA